MGPTDPVFGATIAGREEVSARLRRLPNVASSLTDGLSLPVVPALLAVYMGEPPVPAPMTAVVCFGAEPPYARTGGSAGGATRGSIG